MLIYVTLFLFVAIMATQPARPHKVVDSSNSSLVLQPFSFLLFFILLIFVGLRHEIGGDWGNYIYQIDKTSAMSFEYAISSLGDPLYQLIKWYSVGFGSNTGDGPIHFLNFMCALFFAYGLVLFCNAQPRPWLAFAIAVPYLLIVVGMGYTRQSAAIGSIMIALTAVSQGKTLKYIFWICVAVTIHKTSIIVLPFAVFLFKTNKVILSFATVVFVVFLYLVLLSEYVEVMTQNYLGLEQSSSGAFIRALMNLIPAIFFLKFKNRFGLSLQHQNFWTAISVSVCGLFLLIFILPSTTVVDRVGLYFIPLQLFVLSRLPDAIGVSGMSNLQNIYPIILYYFATLMTWLLFSSHARHWLDYDSYIFILLGIGNY